ncbi:MAG: Poly(A) polymerase I [Chlamydiales bacterium]|nr:Poly(A) polymerase I [Chlamydiales bacterium]MCH9620541.1 Poly(A) polymerase I [Chlamydiales bacterium]MCH9623011.1 Poly(A) polymerase I [Chlamydiales bacterium]
MSQTYSSKEHHIRNNLIDANALSVLKRLHQAGYTSYLVGGGVRDLLMRKKPKDFDISTSAKPEEIKKLFRNCILIGRRFRLAHIRFGRQIIEVATFRAGESSDELIVRDNVWGTPEEDVLRRDFTINGLFYDPINHNIIDYVGGFKDLQKHTLCSIGDPEMRFKQDPVRMIRMQKFRARFGFLIEKKALDAMAKCRNEIKKSSPARVLEEVFRMLESGFAEPFFRLLVESDFLHLLFPKLANYFHDEVGETLYHYLRAADSMNTRGQYRTLDRSVLTATLLFPILDHKVQKLDPPPNLGQIMEMSHSLIEQLLFESFSPFPRKQRIGAHTILHLQYRLTPLGKRKHPRHRIVKQKLFPLALTFLKLRSLVQPTNFKPYEYWKRIYRTEKAANVK